ncbi:5-formyltetrahydrofolate cyclo-ligase [Paenibacillus thalictri]|uniref:5-formyltetrahydrofolate cyclo-ligase n=1 Tax=Paenibacillus thalictri TaxID=2527873 RepID=A0A4Q9DC43_9BACL|nr:5-formyltetrahydrofolate cyclo-ligase [Paenibacillus thalictri]TBL67755.1 5-formyltetrahydrofolate cyclo-ligase [Paenibacillus thalictri]
MNIKERKIELRKQMAQKRAQLTEPERKKKTAELNKTLLREIIPRLEAVQTEQYRPTLFTYMPYKTEADVTPIMEACWEKGFRVVIPKSIQEDRIMRLHEVTSYEDIATGAWGIREPLESLPLLTDIGEVDLVLIPGLAFDLKFGRLGYGGGFYDRFMQRYAKANRPKPYLLAAAFELQLIAEVPLGMFDFRVHHIVTESRSVVASSYTNHGSEKR